jgi:murein DD-endopeptidase MepM/ murein hydrolase activator NlpD
MIFVSMVAVKLLLPAKMTRISAAVTGIMEDNMDVTAVFSAVGRAVSGGGSVQDTLDDVYTAVFGGEDEDAARVFAPIGWEEPALPTPQTGLRAFAQGSGSSFAWAAAAAESTDGETASGTAAETEIESENGGETTAVHQVKQSDADTSSGEGKAQAEAMQLACVLYSGDMLPDNVRLEQQILNFSYCTPLCGTLSSGFGYREHPVAGEERFHYGIDLAADTGTEIDCFADGSVTAVGESSSYGKYLIVAHADGYSTLYAHCSTVTVSSGAAVQKGQKLAEVGETGMATGPHLHFELHMGDVYVNPIYYVTTV